MNKTQTIKILQVMLIATALMFAFEVFFSFDCITNWISDLIYSADDWLVYLIVWVLMFVQVCLIPIPAYVVLNACVIIPSISLGLGTATGWLMVANILSAYIAGAVVAYWIGRIWGQKAVKWCAGSDADYDKWADFINRKGKGWYALTVLLPIFPDDLLVLVAGSVKLGFWFFFWTNLICRGIGLICMVGALQVLHSFSSGGVPISVIAWGVVLVGIFVAWLILKIKRK